MLLSCAWWSPWVHEDGTGRKPGNRKLARTHRKTPPAPIAGENDRGRRRHSSDRVSSITHHESELELVEVRARVVEVVPVLLIREAHRIAGREIPSHTQASVVSE